MRRGLTAAAALAVLSPPAHSAPQHPAAAEVIEVILDASASMGGLLDGTQKLAVADTFVQALRQELNPDGEIRMALRVYGSGDARVRGDCGVTDLRIRASAPNPAWSAALAALSPAGRSSTGLALEHAASDTAATYVLITDGGGSCGQDACAVWRDVVERGGGNRRARLHVVLLGATGTGQERLRCLSRAGSGSFTVIANTDAARGAAEKLALVLRNRGLLDLRLSVGGEPLAAPVRVVTPLTGELVAAFPARGPHRVPAGMYTVIAETAPHVTFERVLVLPGETVILEDSAFGRLVVEVRNRAAESLSAAVSIRRADGGPELRYAPAGEPLVLGAGAYDVTVDMGDSILIREGVRVRAGATTAVILGGSGTLKVEAEGFASPPLTRAIAYGGGRADTLQVGETAALPAGRYRVVVHTIPLYVTEAVVVEAGRHTTTVLPPTGILGVDLYGMAGLAAGQRIDVRETLTGELYGTLANGERRLAMPGIYRLDLRTVPPRTIDAVSVAAGEERIVVRRGLSRIELAAALAGDGTLVRLEILFMDGTPLASATARRPAMVVWPGVYRVRVWRGPALLWQGQVSVASDKSARIDLRRNAVPLAEGGSR